MNKLIKIVMLSILTTSLNLARAEAPQNLNFSDYDIDNSKNLSRDEIAKIYNKFKDEINNKIDKELITSDDSYYYYFLYYFWHKIELTEKLSSYQQMQAGVFISCYKRKACLKRMPNTSLPSKDNFEIFKKSFKSNDSN